MLGRKKTKLLKTIDATFQIMMFENGTGNLTTIGYPDNCSSCVVQYRELVGDTKYKVEITVIPCFIHQRGKDVH